MHNKASIDCPLPTYVHPKWRNRRRSTVRFGFDLHGVVDTNPVGFRKMMAALIASGCEVHIITGATWERERPTLKRLRIPFTHFFSITNHHMVIGTKVVWADADNPHIDRHLWDETKAIYCKVHRMTMHFDDSDIYGLYFQTPYIRFFAKDSERILKMHLVPQKAPKARRKKKK